MGDQVIDYRLPLSAVRVSGTLKHTHDTVLGTDDPEPAVGVELVTIGDPHQEQILTYTQDWVNDTTLGLERSEDGRLTSTSTESTGQGAKVLTAATGLIATGIGFAIAGVPGAALAATATTEAGRLALRRLRDEAAIDENDRKVAEKYREQHRALADARVALAERVASLTETITELARGVANATTPDARREKAHELRAAEAALAIVRSELDKIDRHFSTWRAATITSRVETVDRLITLDEFAAAGKGRIEEGRLLFDADDDEGAEAAQDKLRSLWEKLHLFIEFIDESPVPANAALGAVKKNHVVYREPRWATLRVCRRDGKGAVIESERRYGLSDNRSVHRTFELRRSWFARKSSKVTFSPAGVATGFASGSTSSVAAFAESVGGLPATVSGSLKSVGEISDSVYALRTKALDNELARVKKTVELRQQRIVEAGLDVTEAQAAELEGLKQRQAMLEARKAIIEASDAIEDLRAPPSPPGALAQLQAEVALLRAQLEKVLLARAVSSDETASIDVADILRYTMAARDGDS